LYEYPARFGLLQNEREFLVEVGWVDRHQRDACERGTELDKHPFWRVCSPHGHVLTWRKATKERARDLFSVIQK
jgi:hypothetical protein